MPGEAIAVALITGGAGAIGQVIVATLARHGIVHPDLNGKNILICPRGDGGCHALVIDVDVIAWDASRPMQLTLERNVRRLARSLRKAQRRGESTLSAAASWKLVGEAMRPERVTSPVDRIVTAAVG